MKLKPFPAIYVETKAEFPNFKLVRKSDSKLMKAIGFFLRFVSFGKMSRFMTHFVTTIGTTVYRPSLWDSWEDHSHAAILRHERVHMRQERRMGKLKYSLYYLFWFFPIGFAYGRMKLEQEAYAESILCCFEAEGIEAILNREYRERVIAHFTGPEYIWMWPFRKRIEHWFDGVVEELANR